MMAGFEEKVKTQAGRRAGHQAERRTDPNLSSPPQSHPSLPGILTINDLQYDIARRADALFIAKNLKLRCSHECSEAHFNEFKRLVAEEGETIDETCAAHSDFGAWMASETERQRGLSPEDAEADVARTMARLRLRLSRVAMRPLEERR